jgi:hypothetical protein
MLEDPNIPKEAKLPEVYKWDNGDEATLDPVIKADILKKHTLPETEAEEL